jgi:hypothetical protein
MRWILIFILSGLAVFGIAKRNGHSSREPIQSKSAYNSFAVLELFTSEGCSSCPPADRLLPQLANEDANIIPLSFHVDYWNNLGWKDPFSSSKFSDRQREYGQHFRLESIYTPQLIINGEYELVGSNRGVAETDIKKLLKEAAPVKLTIDEVNKADNKLKLNCHLEGAWQNSNLLAAVVQKHAEMNVKAGENRGSKLSHTNVVRSFIEQPAKEKINFEIDLPNELKNGNWQLVIYMQQKSDLKITGVATYEPS